MNSSKPATVLNDLWDNIPANEAVLLEILRVSDLLARVGNSTIFSKGLSMAQFNILMVLRRRGGDGMSQKQIVENLLTTKGNVSIHMKNLTDAGLVRRRVSKHDGRMHVVTLTAKGNRILESLEPQYLAQIETLTKGLPAAEVDTTLNLLAQIRDTAAATLNTPS